MSEPEKEELVLVKTPEEGETLSLDDIDLIFDLVMRRQERHPDEPVKLSFWLVMTKIGEKFRKVRCIELEWEGIVAEVPENEKCPNGHDLKVGPGLAIGWVHA